MIENGSDSADEALTKTNRHKAEAEIWSTMDDSDIETLADTMLQLGKRSSIAAGAVRMTAQGYLNIRALFIIAPRLYETVKWYPEHGGFGI